MEAMELARPKVEFCACSNRFRQIFGPNRAMLRKRDESPTKRAKARHFATVARGRVGHT
jgi:hypothetical protein